MGLSFDATHEQACMDSAVATPGGYDGPPSLASSESLSTEAMMFREAIMRARATTAVKNDLDSSLRPKDCWTMVLAPADRGPVLILFHCESLMQRMMIDHAPIR